MIKHIISGVCLLGIFSVSAQNLAVGTVFEDSNQNGEMDSGEKGIEKVAVTNGKEVVLTNSKGKYELPLSKDMIISVIKPSGYRVATNTDNLPQFFYIHKPEGSPKLKFPGVKSTGEIPKSVDFALIPSEEKEDFTALIFGDPQPYTQEEVDYFADGIVAEVEGIENVPFGLSLGDLVGNDLDLFNPYIKAVKNVGISWYNLLGNHDINFDVENDTLSDETYEAHFGPANYAFNYGKVHFLVLDDVLYPDPRDGKGYLGGFREDQLQFIENDLKHVPKDHLIVIALHIPLSEPDGRDTFRDEDRDRLFQLLEDFPNTLSLSAHTHIQRQGFFGKEEGWQQDNSHHHYNVGTTSGDWYSGKLDENNVPISTMRDGTPKGYAFINFNGNDYNIDYKVAGKPADYQMEVFAPKVVAKGRRTKAGIYVNFFMGTEDDEVLYRIDEWEWKEMQYIEDYDPSYVEMVYEWDLAEELMPGRRSSNPIRSEHLWRGSIPTKLETGEHDIEIKATDMFGKTHTTRSSYRLAEPLEEVIN
ncbi:calcineurin-like phosphoesterase C-terminal domain-containing protein [Salegentibacter salegens]|uniref:3',5'-cyclic AMP phosphodiesterase CpdA n=1 Tax=Salegentibacter salegens TaxID=143223 RepID=A0A1M7MMS7_9FLAO|nr:calcineurin-like phosphoesterase family protein [Salegentibacter salegens]PRX43247.1 3',5'-cyclic AMP phosphodiesterase CpdA [Salegentibacter salegens]SHM92246.1 3',5'-cyclic AMP phosphodiesterase CpdA [Salegentibacter salegens]